MSFRQADFVFLPGVGPLFPSQGQLGQCLVMDFVDTAVPRQPLFENCVPQGAWTEPRKTLPEKPEEISAARLVGKQALVSAGILFQ